MDAAYWLQIAIMLVPMIAMTGVIYEKIRQIERRLDGNGSSVPGRCGVHAERLDSQDQRLAALEKGRDPA